MIYAVNMLQYLVHMQSQMMLAYSMALHHFAYTVHVYMCFNGAVYTLYYILGVSMVLRYIHVYTYCGVSMTTVSMTTLVFQLVFQWYCSVCIPCTRGV